MLIDYSIEYISDALTLLRLYTLLARGVIARTTPTLLLLARLYIAFPRRSLYSAQRWFRV